MCGSGTLAIEAALIGINKAPGLLRANFGFMHTLLFDSDAWTELKRKTIALIDRPLPKSIVATDIDMNAIDAARKNAENAGVKDCIKFTTCGFEDTQIPEGSGIVVLNPEYGIRLGNEKELEPIYRGIGSFFKHSCQGYRGYVFTGNTTLAGKIGLKSQHRTSFQNGTLECRLYHYDLYKGKKEDQNEQ
jgi:putative N6-adenine-specific DNA methylase